MANISSYPSKAPKLGDIMIFSETYDVNAASPVVGNPTKSTSVSGIGAAISPTIATGTINTIAMFTTANKTGDSPIVFDGSSSTAVTGDLTALNDLIAGRDLNVTRTGYFGNDLNVTGKTIIGVSEYNDNADAIAGGEVIGTVYRTGDLLKIVH
tara:strand:- start:601 stop:1062 length:462 start_codon:yes stop_codon:yes gene_type:complete